MKIKLRAGTLQDVPALTDLLVNEFHASYVDWFPPVDAEKVCNVVLSTIVHGRAWVAQNEDGRIVGSIGGRAQELWFSRERYFGDSWLYTVPEYRRSRLGVTLIKTFVAHARGLGLRPTITTVTGGCERKDKLFARLGFTRLGGIYRG